MHRHASAFPRRVQEQYVVLNNALVDAAGCDLEDRACLDSFAARMARPH